MVESNVGDSERDGERDNAAVAEEQAPDAPELDLDDEADDLEGVMRDAVAAVEEVQGGRGRREDGEYEPATGGPLGSEVDRLRGEVAELKDRSMRTLAELDNFRKRAERERQDIKRYALVEPMRDLLDVVDNLERALEASGSLDDLKAGVEMILRQIQGLLRQHGVQEVPGEGVFDPNIHEAVGREERPDLEAPEVTRELQRGYRIHERLLRPARVMVAVPASNSGDGEG